MIAAGGTGGHVFPAQAFAEEFKDRHPDAELLFAGAGLSTNPYFLKEKFSFVTILSATPAKSHPMAFLKALGMLFKGWCQSIRLLWSFRPQLIVGFGSFHSFPLLAAAVVLRMPFILYESNCLPGRVNRLLSRFACFSAIQFSQASQHLKGKVLEAKMPIWKSSSKKTISREEAVAYYGLQQSIPTILIFGGSQGADAVNKTVAGAFALLAKRLLHPFQIIHLAGTQERADALITEYRSLGIVYCVKAFEEQMQQAWTAADMVICRAGAATLAEQIAYEVPGILIPFPYASEDHQRENAFFLEKHIGGGYCVLEKNLNPVILADRIALFLDSDPALLRHLKQNIQDFKKRKADTPDIMTILTPFF